MSDVISNTNQTSRRTLLWVVLIFVAAFAARLAGGLYTSSGTNSDSLKFDDERWYWAIAKSYDDGNGMVGEFGHRAERMPVYPWFLSWFTSFDNGPGYARVVQWAIGALAAVLCFLLAKAILPGWAAVLAGLGVAFDPGLVGCSSLLLTETVFVTAAIGLWYAAWPLIRREQHSPMRWIIAGLMAALCVHVRESSLLIVLALAVVLVVARRDKGSVLGALAMILIVVASLFPWAYRNNRVIGQWCWLTSRGGISLYDGVRPGATGASDLAGIKDAPEVVALSETDWNNHFSEAAIKAIKDDPLRVAKLGFVKLRRMWSPVLNAAEYQSNAIRLAFACWYIPLFLLALVGIVALWKRPATMIILLLPAITLSMIHFVYIGSVRYRLGAIPTLVIVAAFGLTHLIGIVRPNSRGEQESEAAANQSHS